MKCEYSSSHQHIPKKSKTSCTVASSVVPLISMGAVCYAYECKYSERNMWSVHFILSIVIWTPLALQLMAGTRAGLRGGNGDNCPGPPAARGPPWWNLFVSNKILVWKIFVIQKWHKNTTLLYSYVLLSMKGTQQQLISLHQGWGTYLLSRAAWIVHYRWRAAKSIDFILNFHLYLIMRKSGFFWITI